MEEGDGIRKGERAGRKELLYPRKRTATRIQRPFRIVKKDWERKKKKKKRSITKPLTSKERGEKGKKDGSFLTATEKEKWARWFSNSVREGEGKGVTSSGCARFCSSNQPIKKREAFVLEWEGGEQDPGSPVM